MLLPLLGFGRSDTITMSGSPENRNLTIDPASGFVAVDAGQIVRGMNQNAAVSHVWLERMLVQTVLRGRLNDRMEIVISPECQMSFSYPKEKNLYATLLPLYSFYLNQASGEYCFGAIKDPWLRIGAGLFPYKYNPDARNLGEYLFRTGTYPAYILNNFDQPSSRLLGLRAHSDLARHRLSMDLFLTSEFEFYPMEDFSLAFLVGYNLWNYLDLGAGVDFSHLISVDKKLTTPHTYPNFYFNTPQDSIAEDTSWYTFRGTKIVARLTIDPKGGRHGHLFGSEDLKIYGEIAVIGVENQGPVYAEINERMPWMLGFNVPAFNLLDVLAVEAEYFNTPYYNDYNSVFKEMIPQPYIYGGTEKQAESDKWKWSVYAKKTVAGGLKIIAQAARDHMRVISHDYARQDQREALPTNGDWAYTLRVQFAF